MTRKSLGWQALPADAIAEGATTPDPGQPGVWAWSTTLSRPVYWSGSAWASALPGTALAVGTNNLANLSVTNNKIANNIIANGKLVQVATGTFKARATAGTGSPEDLTGTQATALLDTFTLTLKGLVPPPGAFAGAFLRDDGTWQIPASSGGAAWGSITGTLADQADLAAALSGKETAGAAAAVAALIPVVDPLDLSASNPTAPSADTVRVFGRKVGGRMMAAIKGPSGLDTSLQPHSGRNKIATWFPAGNGTVIVANGAAALTAIGTATAANVATTNRHTYQKRLDYLVATAATTAVAGFRAAAAQWSVGAPSAGNGGFHLICRFGPATGVATATNRCFVGMANSVAAPTDVEPSSITNIVGVGWDAADTNIQIMHRGAGAVTKIDTGIPVPTVDRSKSYELALFSPPGTTQQVGYEFTDLDEGGVVFSGVITTNLPTTSTLLAPRGWMSVGGTSSVIGLALMSLYLESDF